MRRTREERDKVTRIRELFLSPRKTFSPADAADLTGTDLAELERQIEKGHVAARRIYELEKPAVLRLALNQWSLEEIFRALGTDAKDALPPLLHLERMELRVPGYVVRAIRFAARKAGVTPAEAVRLLFHDYAVDVRVRHREEVDAEFPGFAEALFFPEKPWKD